MWYNYQMKIKQKNKKFKKGFTLIELLIVIAIIGIMTAALFVSMSRSGTTNALKVAGRQLAGAIRETQNYALTGKQKDLELYPCAFRFSIDYFDDGSYYNIDYAPRSINEQCGDVSEGGYVFEPFVNPVKFVGINSAEGEAVIFTVPHAKYASPDVDSEYTEYTLKKKGKEYKVRVYSSGVVEEVGLGEDD